MKSTISRHTVSHKRYAAANTDADLAKRLDSLQRAFANHRRDFQEAVSEIKKLVISSQDNGGLVSYDK